MTLTQSLRQAEQAGLDRLDAHRLLLHALGRPLSGRAWLIAHGDDPLDDAVRPRFDALCEQRLDDVPLAYLSGRRGFHGLDLQVDRRVLDPRPDTETLVDWALERLQGLTAPRVLDLGTGSGAVALAIAQRRPDAQVWATDASADALAVARANGLALGLRVQWRQGDWFQALDAQARPLDLIVSNPPYLAEDDPHLVALRHEPRSALVSGPDGLDALRTIVGQAPRFLAHGAWLLLEHGWQQAEAVGALLQQAGFATEEHRRDLAGQLRCTGAPRGRAGN